MRETSVAAAHAAATHPATRGLCAMLLLFLLAVAGPACPPATGSPTDGGHDAGPTDGGTADGGPTDGGPTDGGGDAGPDGGDGGSVVDVDYGIDARPSNPSCLAPPRPTAQVSLELVEAFPGLPQLNRPLMLRPYPEDPDWLYVIEQPGRVLRFHRSDPAGTLEVALDHRAEVDDGPNEAGLLGFAFHPDFASNHYVYLSYNRRAGGALWSRVARFTVTAAGTLDPTSEAVVFEVEQPYGNHNGGHIVFGPAEGPAGERYLYLGLGDGGSGGDPLGNGQNTSTVLGAILRLDVDGATPYAIPPDNPFAGGGGAPEIFAWGLRNPWRFSFDRATGDLWAGDVGQNRIEEIDLVQLGGNYGWNIKEGSECFGAATCDSSGLIDPVVEYSHAEGQSVTGGYVYRGSAIPELVGVYIFGDFASGTLWGIFSDAGGNPERRQLLATDRNIASFAEDADGEILLLDLGGRIDRLARRQGGGADPFPERLSETGCVDPNDPTQMAPGLIPYAPAAPLWSDGLQKDRWMALPDGATIDVDAQGDLVFPVGTVLIKTFAYEGRRIETRLLVHHDDGWAGYAYEWNEAQDDAVLLPAGKRVTLPDGRSWLIPSRSQCLACHTQAAGYSLGLEVAQLNHAHVYEGRRRANQMATLDHIGLFTTSPGDPSELPAFPAPEDAAAPIAERARAYLHANCSMCHRPGSTGRSEADMRWWIPYGDTALCNADPSEGDLGIAGAKRIAPGDPDRSLVSVRMKRLDAHRMPPLGTDVVDPVGTEVIDAWIASQSGCP